MHRETDNMRIPRTEPEADEIGAQGSQTGRILVWFRHDLRLEDNPALYEASKRGPITPYVVIPSELKTAFDVWRYAHIQSLNTALKGGLNIYMGAPIAVLKQLIAEHPIAELHWNSLTQQPSEQEQKLIAYLKAQGIDAYVYPAPVLWPADTVYRVYSSPYRLFTPYYRACLKITPQPPLPRPEVHCAGVLTMPPVVTETAWMKSLLHNWPTGASAAASRAHAFLEEHLPEYQERRDSLEPAYSSSLSPYLAVGCYSERMLYAHTLKYDGDTGASFIRQLCWRSFAHMMAYHTPTIDTEPLRPVFNHMQWENNEAHIRAWKQGNTGVPIIDAGMRALWQTGYVPNRLRMLLASFLTKHLNVDWRIGAEWFMHTLLDADRAVNAMNWQWVAGTGIDSAPYYRIFNPVTQARTYDPQGQYIRSHLPEVADAPTACLHNPWQEPLHAVFQRAGYPRPIILLEQSRVQALERYAALKTIQTDGVASLPPPPHQSD